MTFEDNTEVSEQPAPVNPERSRVVLLVVSGPDAGRHVDLPSRPCFLGRGERAALRLSDPYVSREHALVERCHDDAVVISDNGSTFGIYVEGQRVRSAHLRDGQRVHLSGDTVLCVRFQDPREAAILEQIKFAATRDALTGVHNRHYLFERLDQEHSFARRHDMPLSLLMLDIDEFKTINDEFGHPGGDRAIREIARILQESIRREDVLARYGGDEFVIIARGYPPNAGMTFGERLLRIIRRRPLSLGEKERVVTVSVGVSGLGGAVAPTDQSTFEDLLSWADAALYASKRDGRNRVTEWTPSAPSDQDGILGSKTLELSRDGLFSPRSN